MNKTIIIAIVAILVVGSVSFYAGMQYGKSKNQTASGNFANLSPQERQARMQPGGGGAGGPRGTRAGANFATGEIISKDDKSITIKSGDGGSKIVFFSNATQIMKTASSSPAELKVGEQITTNGTANSDGSLTSQSIQIRPNIANPPQKTQ